MTNKHVQAGDWFEKRIGDKWLERLGGSFTGGKRGDGLDLRPVNNVLQRLKLAGEAKHWKTASVFDWIRGAFRKLEYELETGGLKGEDWRTFIVFKRKRGGRGNIPRTPDWQTWILVPEDVWLDMLEKLSLYLPPEETERMYVDDEAPSNDGGDPIGRS